MARNLKKYGKIMPNFVFWHNFVTRKLKKLEKNIFLVYWYFQYGTSTVSYWSSMLHILYGDCEPQRLRVLACRLLVCYIN